MKSPIAIKLGVQSAFSLALFGAAFCAVANVGCSSDAAAAGDGTAGNSGAAASNGAGSGGSNPIGGQGVAATGGTAAGGGTAGAAAQGGATPGGSAQGGAGSGGTSPTAGSGSAGIAGASGSGGQAGGAATDTWDSYAKGFMMTYCVSCHNDDNAGTATRNYHMLDAVKAESTKVACGVSKSQADWTARGCTGGPAARQFPAGNGAKPMDGERDRLLEWIDAGMP